MSKQKKIIRERFRQSCFQRDRYRCVMCNFISSPEKAEMDLDAHHITNREAMPNGGYVAENGITLCAECHKRAEEFYSTGTAHLGYTVSDLYWAIKSSYEKAVAASKTLKMY